MPDNTKSKGGRDRQRVAGGQDWEVNYMKEKFNVSGQQVAGAIKAVGNDRKKVEEYLKEKSSR
ncbi:MAG: DUF3606 domain-containing protein [Bacteroidota bacterium]